MRLRDVSPNTGAPLAAESVSRDLAADICGGVTAACFKITLKMRDAIIT